MTRRDVKHLSTDVPGCPVTLTCMESGDHSHPVCAECGAVDYTGRCLTCITLRSVRIVQMVRGGEGR